MDSIRRETDINGAAQAGRSTDHRDYQDLPQSLAVMPKLFPDGHRIAAHSHPRDQLIFAVTGVMRVVTAHQAWVVPPDRALLIPAGTEHAVEMRGAVEMRTLYISPTMPECAKVLNVSPLLRELIRALSKAPIDYSGDERAEQIARLIGLEMQGAEALPLNTPLPGDPRLRRLCQKLLLDPSNNRSLDFLAADTGASARTLARLCLNELGMGFSDWRRRVRFARAFELLEQGAPMKQVAGSCGYRSASAFTFAFRKEFGSPPSAFRIWPDG